MGTLLQQAPLTMQDVVASVDHLIFDVEIALESQLGAQRLPFAGMDST
jgi:cleavage and polyadenylation specificity factor subunit 4